MSYSQGIRVPKPFQASGACPKLMYSTAISTARNPTSSCYKFGSWSLFAVCDGAGTCGDYLSLARLELNFNPIEDGEYLASGICSYPIRVWPNNLDELVFYDITLGDGNGLRGYDGGSVRIAFAIPSGSSENPWKIVNDYGTRAIDFATNKNANGEFSLRMDEGFDPDEGAFDVINFQSNVVNTNAFWAHMTLTKPGGEPVTHILPILVCAFNPIKKSNYVYMAPSLSIPDVIRIKNAAGNNAFVRPGPHLYGHDYLATYDNRETAEAAYAQYGSAFDDWVKECMDCGEDCGTDGHEYCVWDENGNLEITGIVTEGDWAFPQNCTTTTRWILAHPTDSDEGGVSGQIRIMAEPLGGGREYSLGTLSMRNDTKTSVTFSIPPCTQCWLEGSATDQGGGFFELTLAEDKPSDSGRECTPAIVESFDNIPKTQGEWDETHNVNELEQEMTE